MSSHQLEQWVAGCSRTLPVKMSINIDQIGDLNAPNMEVNLAFLNL